MTNASSPLLSVDSAYVWRGGRPVLRGAWLHLRAGEVTVLVGRNGAGKSTLLDAITGQIPARIHVSLGGEATIHPVLSRLARRGLWYAPQAGGLAEAWTVQSQVRLVAVGTAVSPDDVVSRLRLGGFSTRRARTLSGGERRRLAVALALLRRPRCLLMDEPFQGTAPKDRELIGRELRGLASEGCAVLITGHEIRDLESIADRAFRMVDGSAEMIDSPADAFRIS